MKKSPSYKVFLTDIDHQRHLEVIDEEANIFSLILKQSPFAQAAGNHRIIE